ncbi:hypothetical protein A2W32_00870 [candidate division WWE3 bacterium RBG_16_37_10]|uniref:Uncharacterized protein n=1 Tax=candidate division WWE3 bacterium RBG_16_37_10 TaxID=1802610 RepID=A0A1F4UXN6_UNCKA|nr:MAG: hypothetical protein A2W32_00870 [candidate division WWE3 bacterium RBG_16_37_10]
MKTKRIFCWLVGGTAMVLLLFLAPFLKISVIWMVVFESILIGIAFLVVWAIKASSLPSD